MSNGRKRAHTPGGRGGGKQKKSNGDKDAVEVVCRLTPYNGTQPCLTVVDENLVKCAAPAGFLQRNGLPYPDRIYEFGQVFDETDTQKSVFERCSIDLIEHLITGRNALLFTYGVTGSGKTYTMTGNSSPMKSGILPRTLDTIFNSIDNRADKCIFAPTGKNTFELRSERDARSERLRQKDKDYSNHIIEGRYVEQKRVAGYNDDYICAVFVSYIEIYNNNCYDLLNDSDTMVSLDPHMDGLRQVYVPGAKEVEVESADEALELLANGDARRRTSDTILNKESSRSHSVFTIKLVMAPYEERDRDASSVVVGQFSLVDLAGSERAKRTLNTGERLNEASKINQSLMTLRQCIEKLRRNQRTTLQETVPFRDSKLTFLFKNFFEGSGKVRMVICVNPRPDDYEENINVLSFAEESQAVQVAKDAVKLQTLDASRPNVPRRFFSKWNTEIDSYVSSSRSSISEFPTAPSCDIRDPSDCHVIAQLRDYYADKEVRVSNDEAEMRAILAELEPSLRGVLCLADYERGEREKLIMEKEEESAKCARLSAEVKQLQRKNTALHAQLSRYENEDERALRTEEELRRAQKEKRDQMREQKEAMVAALEICGTSPSVALLRNKFTSNDPSKKTTATQASASSSAESRRQEREARDRIGFYNPKYNQHRRSKSAPRVLDHQPAHRVPTGAMFRPKMPSNSRTTTNPRPDQLKASSGYVLTHQEVDEEGNLSTSIVKGECIPTAGGGTAVCFNDVEILSHESPTKSHKTRL